MRPNTFQTPNVLVDIMMPHLSGAEFKCLIFMTRKTYGWGKSSDQISLSQFVQGTGLSKPQVIKALASLCKYNVAIKTKHEGQNSPDEYELNIDWLPKGWNPAEESEGSKQNLPQSCIKELQKN